MGNIRAVWFVIGGAFLILVNTPHAIASEMDWLIQSRPSYKVQLEFQSQTRNHVWPGNGRAYSIDDYGWHRYSLNCQYGEKICYGAWPTGGDDEGTYWGVGVNNEHGCKNCCGICGVDNPEKRLIDPDD